MAFTGYDYSPGLSSLSQGISSIVDALKERAATEALMKSFNATVGGMGGAQPQMSLGSLGQSGQAPAPKPAMTLGGLGKGSASDAIAGIESGGRYDALGPVTKSGDRAYGKFQVMGANIPEWTREALGQPLTAQQFLASPEAQEAVFAKKFGDYEKKYGPEGAARAWFAGEGGMNDPNRKDILGTSVSDYARKFNAAYEGGGQARAAQPAPVQVAQAGGQPTGPSRQQVEQVRMLLANPATREVGKQLWAKMLSREVADPRDGLLKDLTIAEKQKALGAKDFKTVTDPETGTVYQYDPNNPTGTKTALTGAKKDQPTTDQRELIQVNEERQKAGLPALRLDEYKTAKARAGATTVNVGPSEGKFSEETGKALAKRFEELSTEGDVAATDLRALAELRRLGGTFETGGTAALQGWLAERGIAVGKNIDQIQAYGSLVDKLTPQQRVPGSGATSDFDAKMFKASLPGLIRTPGGNELIINTLESLASNRIERAAIAQRAQTGEITPKEAVAQLRKLQDDARAMSENVRNALAEQKRSGNIQMPGQSAPLGVGQTWSPGNGITIKRLN